MSNPIRTALATARQWILESGLSERSLAAKTGLAARTIGYFKEPGRDPRVSTLAKIVDAMDADALRDNALAYAQEDAQGDDKANNKAAHIHCGAHVTGEAA